MEMTIHDHIRQMRERAKKATPGPWGARCAYIDEASATFWARVSTQPAREILFEQADANAAFSAAARTDLPALADCLEIAVKALEDYSRVVTLHLDGHATEALAAIHERLNRNP